ncbi:transcription-repair coupling factor [bacterium]|nr:transcription-repair coupling factor [bacterium]
MPLRSLLTQLNQDTAFTELCQLLDKTPDAKAWVTGLWGSASPYFWSGVRERLRRPMLLITPTPDEARRLYDDCRLFLEHPDPEREELFLFPGRELLPYEHALTDMDLEGERLEVLLKLADGEQPVVIASLEQVREALPDPVWLLEKNLVISKGQYLDMDKLIHDLVERGYAREHTVEGRGQFAVRGGILDIFPPADLTPWRIEFEGSEVFSIRQFFLMPDEKAAPVIVHEVRITPAKMFSPSSAEIKAGLADCDRSFGREKVRALREKIGTDAGFPGAENYLPFFIPPATLLDYLAGQTIVVMLSPGASRQQAALDDQKTQRLHWEHKKKEPVLPKPELLFEPFEVLGERLGKMALVQTARLKQSIWPEPEALPEWPVVVKGTEPLRGNIELLIREAQALQVKGLALHLVSHNQAEEQRMRRILAEQAANLQQPDLSGHFVFHLGHLKAGFQYPAGKFVLFTDQEIFNRRLGRPKPRRMKGAAYPSQPIADILELKSGDLAVHRDHGVARYKGVVQLNIDGGEKEFVYLAYANDEKLYVPTDQLRLVEKYIGGDHSPRINKLGTGTWEKTKQKVKASVTELARQLLDIYATRQVHQAHTFGPDTSLVKEFEDAFPYEETPDQARAIAEVKQDMESSKPMDRLICGDVGFGKTEVAMRAAFKAVQDGFQVAILVPTTILADQHFATFRERMAAYPIRIEMLSRFRSTAEQNEVIRDLAQGAVDIVIGTHKLLGKEIRFSKLGLFILDEEQHFGVAQKEKLKKIRTVLDVLTLTATPIPRTLYLSLSGIRDISIIETPPLNRLPIKTQVLEYSEELIREAILREMARNGQVFFIHNRVHNIGQMAERVKNLVPEARVAVAHGKMDKKQLEPVMERFIARSEDVLVSTTIVESGLDMPNVNTIIINRADALGISQLYQLRGRVGRADRQAYAYLFYPVGGAVTGNAEKRMMTLQEFTELGSGIKIAMRDMEIRGSGDVLGPEQSGQVTAVGFETYCSLLEEAVRELRGQRREGPLEVTISIAQDAFIPSEYVPDTMTRLNLYKRLSSVQKEVDLAALEKEIAARFGPLPQAVQTLVKVAFLRIMARQVHISEIQITERIVKFNWPKYFQPNADLVQQLLGDQSKRIRFLPGEQAGLQVGLPAGDPLTHVKKFLSELKFV